jgi:GNAT superfamily N-acetyltransferase
LKISAFNLEELHEIEPIARACHADFKYPGNFDWETFSGLWKMALETGSGIILRAENSGVLGMMMGPDQFNGWRTALVNFWFVMPSERRKGYGRDLILAAEAIATEEKCRRILMGHPIGYVKFFQRMGFSPIEVGFHKLL